jgi:hypothetical protein
MAWAMGQAGITRYGCCAYVQRIWTSSYASSIAMQLKFRVCISSWSSPLHAPSDRRSLNDTEPHYKGDEAILVLTTSLAARPAPVSATSLSMSSA